MVVVSGSVAAGATAGSAVVDSEFANTVIETAKLLHELMVKQGLFAPPPGRTLETVCDFEPCND
jgi:hypothetical protein